MIHHADVGSLVGAGRAHGIAVGEQTAEQIKVAIGSAWPGETEFEAEVRGREMTSGLPRTVLLTSNEVREAINEPVTAMVDSVVTCLGSAPPELAQDLIVRGIHLVGGGGLLRGMAQRIAHEAHVDVHLVRQPLESVVLGAGQCIESFDEVRAMFMTSRTRR